jgi:uncharacterized protein YqeY
VSLLDKLNDDMKDAMRAKELVVRDTLRMVLAGVKNLRIELGRDVTDADVLTVLKRGVKTRKDSFEQYEKAGREDLASKEAAELAVLEVYLPKALGEDETRDLVAALIGELGLESKRDMGTLMKTMMGRHGAAVDGKLVSRFAGELLG